MLPALFGVFIYPLLRFVWICPSAGAAEIGLIFDLLLLASTRGIDGMIGFENNYDDPSRFFELLLFRYGLLYMSYDEAVRILLSGECKRLGVIYETDLSLMNSYDYRLIFA